MCVTALSLACARHQKNGTLNMLIISSSRSVPHSYHFISLFSFLDFKEVNYLGHTPLELAIQLKSNCSIIQMLSDLEEVQL